MPSKAWGAGVPPFFFWVLQNQPVYDVCSLVGSLVSGSSQGSRLVETMVLPMGLSSPSIALVLALTLPQGSLTSVQWLTVSICIFLCQLLVDPLKEQPCQAPVFKHSITSVMMSGFGVCPRDGSHIGLVFSLGSIFVPVFLLDRNNSGSEKSEDRLVSPSLHF